MFVVHIEVAAIHQEHISLFKLFLAASGDMPINLKLFLLRKLQFHKVNSISLSDATKRKHSNQCTKGIDLRYEIKKNQSNSKY